MDSARNPELYRQSLHILSNSMVWETEINRKYRKEIWANLELHPVQLVGSHAFP
jgi:predicted nucleic acid-binding Zn ribbon protein